MQNWQFDRWVAVVSTLISVISLVLAIYFYRKSKFESRVYYRVAQHKLIGPSNAESPFSITNSTLAVDYGGTKAAEASKLYLVCWNAGKRTIDWPTSALPEDPFQIQLPRSAVVLGDPKVLRATRSAIHFQAERDQASDHVVKLSFSFLDSNDGAIIEVLCGGPVLGYKVAGAFKAARPIRSTGRYNLVPDRNWRDLAAEVGVFALRRDTRKTFLILALGSLSLVMLSFLDPFVAITSLCVVVLVTIGLGVDRLMKVDLRIPKQLRRVPIPSVLGASSRTTAVARFVEDIRAEASQRDAALPPKQ